MHSLLPSLEGLCIYNCPEIKSFPGGLPSKLKFLRIDACDELIAKRMEWDLQRLPSLMSFNMSSNADIKSFLDKILLPSPLTSLSISILPNLKFLDYKGVNTSHLSSTRNLALPKSLVRASRWASLFAFLFAQGALSIAKPTLGKGSNGKDWPRISNIPVIKIDNEIIID
ncbi:hypothetical protein REPUB_Repub20aG0060300 [Reevesia pubescens]